MRKSLRVLAAIAALAGLAPDAAFATPPTTCSLGELAGKWAMIKVNALNSNPNNSRCILTISGTGLISGSCVDRRYASTSASYSYTGSLKKLGAISSCAFGLLASAGGSVTVKGEVVLSAEKSTLSGFFANSQGGYGPVSFTKIP